MKQISCFTAIIITLTITAAAQAGDKSVKLHPVKAACIDYEMSGQIMNGTTKRCHRDYAHEVFEIQKLKMGIAGFTQSQNQHNITIGDIIYSINLSTNSGTKTKNPMYDSLVSSMKGKSAKEMSNAFVAGMGYSPTGATKKIADHNCNVFNSAQMGNVCLTEDGLMLEQNFMGNTTKAVNVAVGEAGDDANYTLYKKVPISEGPDLSNMPNLQDIMNQRR